MKATVSALLALLLLASPLAVLAGAQDGEIQIDRDLQVEVTRGSTDRLGGGDWIRIDVGSTTFAVLYGTQDNPNTPKMIVEYDRYLGAAEFYNEQGEQLHGLTPLPVRTILAQSFDFMLEFQDNDNDSLVDIPDYTQPRDLLDISVDHPLKVLLLRQAWELEGYQETVGDRETTIAFNITATDLPYARSLDNTSAALDRITLSFHIRVALEDTTVRVPVYNFTVNQDRDIVAFEKRTEVVSGVTVNGTFKYDHLIEGWDWGAEDSRLALVTHVVAGNYVPPLVANILRLEFALCALEDGRDHCENSLGDRPLLIEGDTMVFEDEWARIGRLTWISDVVVDDQPMRMLFQLFRAARIVDFHGVRDGLAGFHGVLFGGAYVYPQGNVIYHDPGLDAAVFVPEGQILPPGGILAGLGPYLIQVAIAAVIVVGLVVFRVVRRR